MAVPPLGGLRKKLSLFASRKLLVKINVCALKKKCHFDLKSSRQPQLVTHMASEAEELRSLKDFRTTVLE